LTHGRERRGDLRDLHAQLVLAGRKPCDLDLVGKLANVRGLDGLVRARFLELGPRDSARRQLRFVALQLPCGLLLRGLRLRELRLHDGELRAAFAQLEIRELRLCRAQLRLGLLLRGDFRLGVELEETRVGLDDLALLHQQALEPRRDGGSDVDVVALDIALVSHRLVVRAAGDHRSGEQHAED